MIDFQSLSLTSKLVNRRRFADPRASLVRAPSMRPLYLDYNATTPLDPRSSKPCGPTTWRKSATRQPDSCLRPEGQGCRRDRPGQVARPPGANAGRDRVHERRDREQQPRAARIDAHGLKTPPTPRPGDPDRAQVGPGAARKLASSGFEVELVAGDGGRIRRAGRGSSTTAPGHAAGLDDARQ